MSRGTTFRILAEDNTGSHKHSKEEIHKRFKEEIKNEFYTSKDDAAIEEEIKKYGYAPFIQLRADPDEESKKHGYFCDQVEAPFPVWINTKTGNEAYEITSNDFMSNFNELYEHFNITGVGSSKCREITREEARQMLKVINYFLAKKYNLDIERAVFEDNEFFEVFKAQWFYFRNRFKNNRNKADDSSSQQTIKIIIEDRRVDVERCDNEDECCSDHDDVYSLEDEDRSQAEYLRSVLEAFLLTGEDWRKEEEQKVVYHLVYEFWF